MTFESTQELWKRKDHVKFRDVMKREHTVVSRTSLKDESLEEDRAGKLRRQAIIGNIGFDIFSVCYIDGYDTDKKFMVVNNSASELDSYNFWSLIWDSDCRVIVRFHSDNSKTHHWLKKIRDDEYAVGEFLIRKETIADKFYTQLELTIRNAILRKSKKITHYQYHGFADRDVPVDSAQLVFFLKTVNEKRNDHNTTKSDNKENARGPIAIHSVDCFERAVSICALDICLDQLTKTKSISVPDALIKIRSQTSLESFSLKNTHSLIRSCCVVHVRQIFMRRNPRTLTPIVRHSEAE
ncbi:Tyrosine phosphatase-like protein N3 [Eumeta japonica]|uniref:Tyrosine phosphatase-like protein N3 n=1 Tax=Eumeta variegata TaxID=151549 RepID=A0A4C1V0H5_EUMVA|nr:Tyrosine phosphatase-like protein N3 [Eumeta japonica]